MQFGLPTVITSDQGSKFNNNLDKKLMKLLKIHRYSAMKINLPLLHFALLQTNGLDERFNQTL